jgi:hypothetical protein
MPDRDLFLRPWFVMLSKPGTRMPYSRRTFRKLLEFLDRFDHAFLPQNLLIKVLDLVSKKSDPDSSWIRLLVTRLFPWNPLNNDDSDLPSIDIFIFTHKKDLELLPFAISGALSSSKNPIKTLNVVAPASLKLEILEVFQMFQFQSNFLSDESLFKKYLDRDGGDLPGVPKMEILKLLSALDSPSGIALLIDGDTWLLRKRTWVTVNARILVLAQEYLKRHRLFNSEVVGIDTDKGLGFVSHHQVVETRILQDWLEHRGGIEIIAQKIVKCYGTFDRSGSAFPSEWQLIGALTIHDAEKKTHIAKFSNYGMSRDLLRWKMEDAHNSKDIENLLENIRRAAPRIGSLSLHRYK